MPTRDELVEYAIEQANANGIDPNIFVRQIDQESGFNPNVQSPAGAIGIAQIVPRWHPGVDPWDPYASLRYAARLMRGYLDQFGSYALALAAYNAGAGAVQQYGGVPPYEETQRYVAAILGSDYTPGADSTAGASNGSAGAIAVLAIAALIILSMGS
ncbi:MAG: lytic transglycosylase domain-containing protein [Dehalococcoidales bacterium]|nr:lytic transglycosylase domain-containing protein [Dehalococcoidales bacterium]